MRVEDLHHGELLQLENDGGLIQFAGQRAILVDAVAMGLLRKSLVENLGRTAARGVLTQFGFAHGWRMAEAMRTQFDWESDDDWRRAGHRIHSLEGLFRTQAGSDDPLAESGVTLLASHEAEQHLLHFGRSESCSCWMTSGSISGYLSHTTGREIIVLEDRCSSRGDAACHMVGRPREHWGEDRTHDLAFFDEGPLEERLEGSLADVMESLRKAEDRWLAHCRVTERTEPDVTDELGIVARSREMLRAIDLARRAGRVNVTVVITGESGVGKERFARLIHAQSPRANGPFLAVNCGAITESLLESELFGHKRGAFTGADADRAGLFEAANGGTLLLDEIGDVPAAVQVKLLRVLQEREVRRVGDNQNRAVDVRVLAATNRSLVDEISAGRFREDLYYRLKVVELAVPPLRDRAEDILPLARILLSKAAARMSRELNGFSPAVADLLLRHRWPGNVRELENAMERCAALARGDRVEVEELPEEIRGTKANQGVPGDDELLLSEVEKRHIQSVLKLNDGHRADTASQLGIGSATLYRKLKAYAAEQ